MRGAWLAVWLPGCLWIGPDVHEARKAKMAIDFAVDDLAPDAWSVCIDQDPLFVVSGSVSAIHGGGTFEAWFEVEGDRRRDLGAVTAAPAADGRAAMALELDLTEPLAALPPCTSACETPIRVGLTRIGLIDEQEVSLLLIGDAEPDLAGADFVAADGTREPVAGIVLSDNPADGVSAAAWPEVVFEFADPHLPEGLGAGGEVAYCPDGVDPTSDLAPCIVLEAPSDTVELPHGGDMAFRAPTSAFGAASCLPEARDVRWRLWGIVGDHVCGGPIVRELTTEPLRIVAADCDADGSPAPDDCDDDDPARSPGAEEVWYDGVDADCSGGSDHDQDSDGSDGPAGTGPDCDDLNPAVGPGTLDVCDAFDNDCDGGEPVDTVTVVSIAGSVNHTGADPLGDALAGAGPGDEVLLCPGTYTGNFVVVADGAVRSGTGVAADVHVVGVAGGPALTVDAATVTLDGLTVRDGPDGGIEALDAASLTVEDCDVRGNVALRGGGILAAGSVVVRRTTLTGNAANEGGGIALDPGATLTLEDDTLVYGNTAVVGGGLHLDEATVTLDDTVVIDTNSATAAGGGVWANGNLTWSGGTVEQNEATSGAGFYLTAGFALGITWSLDGVTVRDHVGSANVDGAGVYASGGGALVLDTVEVLSNRGLGDGAGVYAEGGVGLPVDVTLTSCTVQYNDAGGEGGGIAVSNGKLVARGGDVRDNVAAYGAGFHGRGATLQIGEGFLGVDVKDNVATFEGGGVRVVADAAGIPASLATANCEIERNTADLGGGVFLDPDDPATVHVVSGGTLSENVANVEGAALYVDDGTVQLAGNLVVELNSPDGVRVVDEQVEACGGVTVDDPVSNGTADQGNDTDCFQVTAAAVTDTCGC